MLKYVFSRWTGPRGFFGKFERSTRNSARNPATLIMGKPIPFEIEDHRIVPASRNPHESSTYCPPNTGFTLLNHLNHLIDGSGIHILNRILALLSARELGNVNCTATWLREYDVWQSLCIRDFGILKSSDRLSWKQTYKKAWNEYVVWHEGRPDYVQFLGSRNMCQGVWSKTTSNGATVEVMIAM